MNKKLYKKEKQILDYINEYKNNYNELPVITNIAEKFNISISTVSGHLKRLKEKEFLNYGERYNAKIFNSKKSKYERLSQNNTNLKQALNEIKEYVIKEKEFNDNQIQEYKTCIETNLNGKFNSEEKENMQQCMTVNICINYKMEDILQIINKALGDE